MLVTPSSVPLLRRISYSSKSLNTSSHSFHTASPQQSLGEKPCFQSPNVTTSWKGKRAAGASFAFKFEGTTGTIGTCGQYSTSSQHAQYPFLRQPTLSPKILNDRQSSISRACVEPPSCFQIANCKLKPNLCPLLTSHSESIALTTSGCHGFESIRRRRVSSLANRQSFFDKNIASLFFDSMSQRLPARTSRVTICDVSVPVIPRTSFAASKLSGGAKSPPFRANV
jgi:hypothetical protein